MNQPIQLAAFTQEGRASRAALCPVRMLKQYVLRTASWRVTDQLFGPGKKGAPLSKQRLAHWVADSIVEAYRATGCVLPATVKCQVQLHGHHLAHSQDFIDLMWLLLP